ncbi:integrase [Haloferax sp. Atlit-47N]|uniref:tyrosine-type recombinase/integrase n=1 Tax=Haloferax TaxID=2251 RepID=UPI000678C0B6|nr:MULTISPECIES: site-specific integrase [Haloferax]RDZ38758.1 integrase [Haloferax sp. Atlit-47N]
MSDDLDPITPEAGLSYYLDARRYDVRPTTLQSHRARLQSFIDWLDSQGIHNMNDVDLRTVHAYQVYKREDNGENEPCNAVTMQGQISTLRRFLDHLSDIDAVPESLSERIRLPKIEPGEDVDEEFLDSGRAKAILEYMNRFEYATPHHVAILLFWRTSARRGDLHALDLKDFDKDENALSFVHRPETETRLKNGYKGERDVSIQPDVARVIEDYIRANRHSVQDDHGRFPLFTTTLGRASLGTIQQWAYRWTRPCVIGEGCPHDRDPSTCENADISQASGCPSSMGPHAIRKGSITAFRDAGTPREVVSERGDVSEEVLEKHYDKANARDRMRRRREFIPEEI